MASKVSFSTLGCKLNYSETSAVAAQFSEKGFELVESKEPSDIFVLNTCTVTENAEKECRQIIRRVLRNNPDTFVIVTGCYAQLRPEEIADIEGVDLVLGSHEKFDVLSFTNSFEKKELSCIYVSPTEKLDKFNSSFSGETNARTRAFFKVQDGCDYKCSFCTIPLARGGSRSMNPEEVTFQFEKYIDLGYKEVILTGVNVGDYGKNLNTDFYGLLLNLLTVKGDYRIRISSIEPNLLTDNILELVASDPKLCNHFHIPLQSGSNTVLKLMQRRYTSEYYRDLILKAVDKIPGLGIGVDVIAGFPGETEEHFMETYDFLKELPVSYLHVFTYSERPDTKALTLAGEVNKTERKKRNSMLRILSEKKKFEFYLKHKMQQVRVLFESEKYDQYMYGWTDNYIRVKYSFRDDFVNSFVNMQIESAESKYCTLKQFNPNLISIAG